MDKKSFRRKILNEISSLPQEYITDSDSKIFKNLIKLPEFVNSQNIFAYLSVDREPDTVSIIKYALKLGKTIALPLSLDGGKMELHTVNSLNELAPGRFGIPAPSASSPLLSANDIDFIIVPAITFDRNGFRLGRGGGYYDRFLSCTSAFSVGLGRELLIRNIPLENHDESVRCLITESGIYRTSAV